MEFLKFQMLFNFFQFSDFRWENPEGVLFLSSTFSFYLAGGQASRWEVAMHKQLLSMSPCIDSHWKWSIIKPFSFEIKITIEKCYFLYTSQYIIAWFYPRVTKSGTSWSHSLKSQFVICRAHFYYRINKNCLLSFRDAGRCILLTLDRAREANFHSLC